MLAFLAGLQGQPEKERSVAWRGLRTNHKLACQPGLMAHQDGLALPGPSQMGVAPGQDKPSRRDRREHCINVLLLSAMVFTQRRRRKLNNLL